MMKFKWKRSERSTGRYASFMQNDLRSYNCILKSADKLQIKDNAIGEIHNVSMGNFSKDKSKDWQIMFYAKGRNIILKKRFKFEDVEEAKKYLEHSFQEIMSNANYSDMKEKILNLGRLIEENKMSLMEIYRKINGNNK